jgi:translocation protein SEC62
MFLPVLGAIGVCLFPLWPPEVRLGVYYLSLAVAGLIGSLLILCVGLYLIGGSSISNMAHVLYFLTFHKYSWCYYTEMFQYCQLCCQLCTILLLNISVRVILFGLIWLLTFGRHHFWFLPNLNEDVGFFDSFKPLYHHELMTSEKQSDSKEKPNEQTQDPKDEKQRSEEASAEADDRESNEESNDEQVTDENGYEMVDADSLPLDPEDLEVKKQL